MNREILFKAKRIDTGEWVEGYYAFIGNKHIIIKKEPENFYSDDDKGKLSGNEITEVKPKTICRCTGKCDNTKTKEFPEGKLIYENDIVESQLCGLRMVIRYGTYQAYCPADKDYMDSVGFYAEAAGYPDMPIGDLNDYALKIGNIFDNPELLEGGAE